MYVIGHKYISVYFTLTKLSGFSKTLQVFRIVLMVEKTIMSIVTALRYMLRNTR